MLKKLCQNPKMSNMTGDLPTYNELYDDYQYTVLYDTWWPTCHRCELRGKMKFNHREDTSFNPATTAPIARKESGCHRPNVDWHTLRRIRRGHGVNEMGWFFECGSRATQLLLSNNSKVRKHAIPSACRSGNTSCTISTHTPCTNWWRKLAFGVGSVQGCKVLKIIDMISPICTGDLREKGGDF